MLIRRDDSQWPRKQTLTIVTLGVDTASVELQHVMSGVVTAPKLKNQRKGVYVSHVPQKKKKKSHAMMWNYRCYIFRSYWLQLKGRLKRKWICSALAAKQHVCQGECQGIYSPAHWSMISGTRTATEFLSKCIIRFLTNNRLAARRFEINHQHSICMLPYFSSGAVVHMNVEQKHIITPLSHEFSLILKCSVWL